MFADRADSAATSFLSEVTFLEWREAIRERTRVRTFVAENNE